MRRYAEDTAVWCPECSKPFHRDECPGCGHKPAERHRIAEPGQVTVPFHYPPTLGFWVAALCVEPTKGQLHFAKQRAMRLTGKWDTRVFLMDERDPLTCMLMVCLAEQMLADACGLIQGKDCLEDLVDESITYQVRATSWMGPNAKLKVPSKDLQRAPTWYVLARVPLHCRWVSFLGAMTHRRFMKLKRQEGYGHGSMWSVTQYQMKPPGLVLPFLVTKPLSGDRKEKADGQGTEQGDRKAGRKKRRRATAEAPAEKATGPTGSHHEDRAENHSGLHGSS